MLCFLLACTLHWGTPPATRWTLGEVLAPVAEPGLDLALRDAFMAELSGANLLGSQDVPAFRIEVLGADWVPAGRSETGVLYEARLSILLSAGSRQQTFSLSRLSPDPGAALVVATRARIFEELAAIAAARAVSWLSLQPAPETL